MQRCRHQLGDGHCAVAQQAQDWSAAPPWSLSYRASGASAAMLRVQRCHHPGGLAGHSSHARPLPTAYEVLMVGRLAQRAGGGAQLPSLAAPVTDARNREPKRSF
jgi:hypothetical protein